jgi:S1-C subfamily serine protease
VPVHVPVVPSPSASSQASTGAAESTAAIARAVEPAIVDIDTDVASMASQGQEQAAGTGMIITSSGEVLTNNHVIEQATHITISIQGHTGTYGASVIAVDPSKDVALLQIEGYSGALPTVSLGDSASVAVGAPVVAIGNALGLGAQPTTVTGIVSALDRTITASDATSSSTETLHGLLETDAPIQPGDSGGPLIDAHGQVIGMDTAALSSVDSGATLGFAIPIDEARTIVQHMERAQAVDGVVLGERPFLGVFEAGSGVSGSGGLSLGGGTPTSVRGVVVEDVAIGGPAQAAGIEAGDTITRIDATPTPTPTALEKALDAHGIGAQVTVTYVDAAGTAQTVDVTLAGIPS